jgi:transposase
MNGEARKVGSWAALERELDTWQAAGRSATLWWRDDDAAARTPALDRLLGLAQRYGVRPALAVIPALAEATLGGLACLLQHGFAHCNHAAPGAKRSEFPETRPLALRLDDLAAGRARMAALDALPVLVPPWNRIGADLIEHLGALGFRGLTGYRARRALRPAAQLVQVNTHVDVIDWRGNRGFVGEPAALGLLVDHLAARRAGAVDADEPTGLLTHHLDHDDQTWAFVEHLLARATRHPAVRWAAPDQLFAAAA